MKLSGQRPLALPLAAVIAAYAALLPLGKWQPDEFILFHNIAVDGWRAVSERMFGWSPRPVSELLLWGYGTIVNASDRPLVVPFLALLWAGLVGAALMAARRAETALGLVAAFLLVAKPGEMFFWPAGAAAYLVGIGALMVACLAMTRNRPWLEGTALVVAAWSNEVAAAVVLADALLRLAVSVRDRAIDWRMPLVSGAAAAAVVAILLTHRMASGVEMQAGGTGGSLLPSVGRAVPHFLTEILAITLPAQKPAMSAGIAVKALLLLGFRPGIAETPRPHRRAVLRGIALLLGAAASLVLAYRQFGIGCCERHATFRADLIVLALYCFAQAWPSRLGPTLRAALLTVPLLVLLAWHARDVRADHAMIAPTVAARAASWQSGRSPGPDMTWVNPPYPRLASGWMFAPGRSVRTADTDRGTLDWRCFAVLVFFGKTTLIVPPS